MTTPRKEQLADGVTLYCGDCRDVLPIIGRVDAVVTDPPYGNGTEYGEFDDTKDNLASLIADIMPPLLAASSRIALTCGVPNMWKYPADDWVLNWTDPSGEGGCVWGFPSWQPILVWGKDPFLQRGLGRRSDSIIRRFLRETNGHPCSKPQGIMDWIVNRVSFYGEIVLDPLMGSGTTGVSCINLDRSFIGIEIEPKYFDIACRRLSEALRRPRLPFEEPRKIEQMEMSL
jgi:site-specific DNA-methyltransferase (adenine-specific)